MLSVGVIIIKTLEINSQQFVLNSDIEEGFLKGSIWENLFSPYKFVVEKISNLTDEEKAIYMLQVYCFAHIELSEYISTHPNCDEAIETLKKVNIEKKKLCDYIDTKYGALSSGSVVFDGYLNRKMTWEVY